LTFDELKSLTGEDEKDAEGRVVTLVEQEALIRGLILKCARCRAAEF
jgi:hypothetical protein